MELLYSSDGTHQPPPDYGPELLHVHYTVTVVMFYVVQLSKASYEMKYLQKKQAWFHDWIHNIVHASMKYWTLITTSPHTVTGYYLPSCNRSPFNADSKVIITQSQICVYISELIIICLSMLAKYLPIECQLWNSQLKLTNEFKVAHILKLCVVVLDL